MLRGSRFPSPGFMIIDAGKAPHNSFRTIIKTIHIGRGILVYIPPESAFTLPRSRGPSRCLYMKWHREPLRYAVCEHTCGDIVNPVNSPPVAPVAQLDRAPGFEPVKFWFESGEFCFWISDLQSERQPRRVRSDQRVTT